MNGASPSKRQTLEQMRYWAAFQFATEAQKGDFSRYAALVRKFPAMVNANGLGQALASLAAKKTKQGKNAEGLLLEHLERWLTKSDVNLDFDHYAPPYGVDYNAGVLLAQIRENNSRTYLRATVETLKLLNYLKLVVSGLESKTEEA